jgi:hypothetical protein
MKQETLRVQTPTPPPPGSPPSPQIYQRRAMTARSGNRGSEPTDATGKDETDLYDSLEKDGGYATHHPHTEKSALQVGTVALLVFFTVSGGPLGSEDAVC